MLVGSLQVIPLLKIDYPHSLTIFAVPAIRTQIYPITIYYSPRVRGLIDLVSILKEADAGLPAKELCRKYGGIAVNVANLLNSI